MIHIFTYMLTVKFLSEFYVSMCLCGKKEDMELNHIGT